MLKMSTSDDVTGGTLPDDVCVDIPILPSQHGIIMTIQMLSENTAHCLLVLGTGSALDGIKTLPGGV